MYALNSKAHISIELLNFCWSRRQLRSNLSYDARELITHVKADQMMAIPPLRSFAVLGRGLCRNARFRLISALSMARIYFSPLGAAKYGGSAKVKQMLLEDLTIAQGAIDSSTPTE
jgi:hypothetical protein